MLPFRASLRFLHTNIHRVFVLALLCIALFNLVNRGVLPLSRVRAPKHVIQDDEAEDLAADDLIVDLPIVEHHHHHSQLRHHAHGHKLASHKFRDDGLLEVNPDGRHPIYDLMSRAERAWEDKVATQSKTLAEAVTQYRQRYHREPPLGFGEWWKYVKVHNVQLPDEYDQIYRDLEPFWGMHPSMIRSLQSEFMSEPGTYTLSNGHDGYGPVYISSTSMSASEEAEILQGRASLQMDVIQPVSQWLPPFQATFIYHDNPLMLVAQSLRQAALDAAAMQEHLDQLEAWNPHDFGWTTLCPPSTPLRRMHDALDIPNLDELHSKLPKTFIYNHVRSMNPCLHPTHINLNGQLLNFEYGPTPRWKYYPSFSMSTTTMHADILTVAPENWVEDVGVDPPWDRKPHSKLLWRGSTTGMDMKGRRKWRLSQRLRLVDLANRMNGSHQVLHPHSPLSPVGMPLVSSSAELNGRLMDIAFTSNASQCELQICKEIEKDYRFRQERLTWDEANKYKYLLDVDGNGWSARFKRLMTTNSLVLKATICPEWYADRIQSWVHYVPVKTDLTDLYDLMTFFRGDGSDNTGNDRLAEKIATAGKKWSKTFWRKEDETAYMFRLLLEWARVSDPNRDIMYFKWTNEDVEL
ncbi:Beta-1,2-xylosyltransferase 1 Short=Cxt1p [Serendipita indica DSM 11827]|nr:Beta-1,2-xylosyltransferase 1 Short=Cxt1p [Serendipita indica DSM 11827]